MDPLHLLEWIKIYAKIIIDTTPNIGNNKDGIVDLGKADSFLLVICKRRVEGGGGVEGGGWREREREEFAYSDLWVC